MTRTCTLLSVCLCLLAQPCAYADRENNHADIQQRKEALNQIIEQRLEQKRQWEQQQKLKAAEFAQGKKNPYTRTVTLTRPNKNGTSETLDVYLYTWPQKQIEMPEARVFTDPTDHLYIDWLEMTRAHFTLRTKPIDQFLQTDPQAAGELLLKHRSNKSTIGYAILGYHEFLREVSPEAVQGYVEGLHRKHGDNLEVHNEWNYKPQAAFPVFGGQWLYVDYTLTPDPDPDEQEQEQIPAPTRHRDYFFDLEDGIAIIRVQTLPAHFDHTVQTLEKSLRGSYRL